MRTILIIFAAVITGAAMTGCTRESVRLAVKSQQRADEAQQAVFDRQHEALCMLLYRDMQRRLENAGATLDDGQRAALNEVWNERDLIEFWTVQQERSKALRLAGVDAHLYGEQSMVDLLYKQTTAKFERAGGEGN
jgi:hypothetical protein